jgi:hypothetical protein
VDADPAKGAILLEHGEDGLLHFQWKNRTTNSTDEVPIWDIQSLSADSQYHRISSFSLEMHHS